MYRIIIAVLFCVFSSFSSNNVAEQFHIDKNGIIRLYKDVNLRHQEYTLPEGVTIVSKGGVFKNGTLIGNETRIDSERPVFNSVKIKGTWNVPHISTALFRDLSYDNALRDVVALSDDRVQNEIIIAEGDYVFSFKKSGESGISPASNTQMRIDGTLMLKPNDFTNYYIINIKGENINISGSGVVSGDKLTHTGTKGEWGMGINFKNAVNCSVSGLTIKDCWGDCIYIGTDSHNIVLRDCQLYNGRRQGISITSADNVLIKDCRISDISGTDPQFAIDIEPNKNGSVSNVTVDNVTVENCIGGFMIYGRAEGAVVDNIAFNNCNMVGMTGRYSMKFIRATNVTLTGNVIMSQGEYAVLVQEIDSYVVKGNKWKANNIKPLNILTSKNGTVMNNENRK